MASVVVLGAGVIGLTCAHVLASSEPKRKITVVARDTPDDLSAKSWASPWAGANWAPLTDDPRAVAREIVTLAKLNSMISTGRAMRIPCKCYYENAEEVLSKLWYKGIVNDVTTRQDGDLPPGAKLCVEFTSVAIDPAVYLPWLFDELKSLGVSVIQQEIKSLADAAHYGDIIVNATSFGSMKLAGVEDKTMYPVRGQLAIVHAPSVKESYLGLPGGPEDPTYIIPRPNGDVVLGGTFQANRWDTDVDENTAKGIVSRASALVPALVGAPVLRHHTGLRPARHGGPRVEREIVRLEGDISLKVVHAYGFSSYGFQNSWGVAEEVWQLVREFD